MKQSICNYIFYKKIDNHQSNFDDHRTLKIEKKS